MAIVGKSRLYAGVATLVAVGVTVPASAQDRYIGEILKFPYTFCPVNTAEANGQLQSIADNSALYAILGTTYGGDGVTTFGLPNVQSRYTMHVGTGNGLTPRTLGQTGGTETNTMTLADMPFHEHVAFMKGTSATGNATSPVGNAFGITPANKYIAGTTPAAQLMERGTIVVGNTGGGQPYPILPPSLAIRYCVQTFGIFPARN